MAECEQAEQYVRYPARRSIKPEQQQLQAEMEVLVPAHVLVQRSLKQLRRPPHQDLVKLIEKHKGNPHLQGSIALLQRELERDEGRRI